MRKIYNYPVNRFSLFQRLCRIVALQIYLFIFVLFSSAQESIDQNFEEPGEGEVVLVTVGEGPTVEKATLVALRNAIEQTYGAFVSSNTAILNDELVKDEIITVSSGNIRSYEYLAKHEKAQGVMEVTVRSIVSYAKLRTFVKNKGGSSEMSMGTIAENWKIEEFYKRQESIVLKNMINQIMHICYSTPIYDIDLISHEPERISKDGVAIINLEIIPKFNKNAAVVYDIFWNTLRGLGVNKKIDSHGMLQYGTTLALCNSETVPIRSRMNYDGSDRYYIVGYRDEFNASPVFRYYSDPVIFKDMLKYLDCVEFNPIQIFLVNNLRRSIGVSDQTARSYKASPNSYFKLVERKVNKKIKIKDATGEERKVRDTITVIDTVKCDIPYRFAWVKTDVDMKNTDKSYFTYLPLPLQKRLTSEILQINAVGYPAIDRKRSCPRTTGSVVLPSKYTIDQLSQLKKFKAFYLGIEEMTEDKLNQLKNSF